MVATLVTLHIAAIYGFYLLHTAGSWKTILWSELFIADSISFLFNKLHNICDCGRIYHTAPIVFLFSHVHSIQEKYQKLARLLASHYRRKIKQEKEMQLDWEDLKGLPRTIMQIAQRREPIYQSALSIALALSLFSDQCLHLRVTWRTAEWFFSLFLYNYWQHRTFGGSATVGYHHSSRTQLARYLQEPYMMGI